jgi:predicted nucleic acid-binding protein
MTSLVDEGDGGPAKLSPGDAVVLDANVLADLLFVRVASRPEPAGQAAQRILRCCAVIQLSTKLRQETVGAVHHRSLPVPRQAVVTDLQRLERTGKLRKLSTQRVSAVALPDAVAHAVSPKDHHVVRLAVAAGARILVTRDTPLYDARARLSQHHGIRAMWPQEVLRDVSEPADSCS